MMRRIRKHDRFVPPVMQAFRSAFRERDSSTPRDLRNTDEERVIAGRRSSPRNAINESVLKQELADDLSALLNTVNLASCEDLNGFEEVSRSILNYGIEDLGAIAVDTRGMDEIGPRIKEVLQTYESRLIDDTVAVRQSTEADEVSARVKFHITADMYATPSDVPVEFVADVEAITGRLTLKKP